MTEICVFSGFLHSLRTHLGGGGTSISQPPKISRSRSMERAWSESPLKHFWTPRWIHASKNSSCSGGHSRCRTIKVDVIVEAENEHIQLQKWNSAPLAWIGMTEDAPSVAGIRGQSRGQADMLAMGGFKSACVCVFIFILIERGATISQFLFTDQMRLENTNKQWKLYFCFQPKLNSYCFFYLTWRWNLIGWNLLVMSEEGPRWSCSSRHWVVYNKHLKINIEFLFMIFYSVKITNVAYLYLPTCCRATV